jgi:hypothetical protein
VHNGYYGTLTLTNSTLSGNSAYHSGGVENIGSLALTNSTLTGNTARYGGGVYNYGTLALTNSTLCGNSARFGGGVLNYSVIALTNSTLSGNTAFISGGGVLNRGTLTLTNSTLSGNTAIVGGGVENNRSLTLTNSTLSGNVARYSGGGVANYSGTLTLERTLVSGNTADTGAEILSGRGSVAADDFNLFGHDGTHGVVGFPPGSNDIVPSESLSDILAPLALNGGPTFTHALPPGSPAIDAIPWGTKGCGTTLVGDQRWQARPQPAGGPCDIGAYEVGVPGQTLGAWVTGLSPHRVTCNNITTGQAATLNDPATVWDCEAAGLGVNSGDQVALRVQGSVEADATDVGGTVMGMAPSSGGCINLTTGQQVKFQYMAGETAGSCVAAGLVVQPGDDLQMRVQGVAE